MESLRPVLFHGSPFTGQSFHPNPQAQCAWHFLWRLGDTFCLWVGEACFTMMCWRIMGWVVVSNIFYFHPYLGRWSNLTNIFHRGWNHQLEHSWLEWHPLIFTRKYESSRGHHFPAMLVYQSVNGWDVFRHNVGGRWSSNTRGRYLTIDIWKKHIIVVIHSQKLGAISCNFIAKSSNTGILSSFIAVSLEETYHCYDTLPETAKLWANTWPNNDPLDHWKRRFRTWKLLFFYTPVI